MDDGGGVDSDIKRLASSEVPRDGLEQSMGCIRVVSDRKGTFQSVGLMCGRGGGV